MRRVRELVLECDCAGGRVSERHWVWEPARGGGGGWPRQKALDLALVRRLARGRAPAPCYALGLARERCLALERVRGWWAAAGAASERGLCLHGPVRVQQWAGGRVRPWGVSVDLDWWRLGRCSAWKALVWVPTLVTCWALHLGCLLGWGPRRRLWGPLLTNALAKRQNPSGLWQNGKTRWGSGEGCGKIGQGRARLVEPLKTLGVAANDGDDADRGTNGLNKLQLKPASHVLHSVVRTRGLSSSCVRRGGPWAFARRQMQDSCAVRIARVSTRQSVAESSTACSYQGSRPPRAGRTEYNMLH